MAQWTMASDGMPENKDADPNCKVCKGHGVVDTGEWFGCILDNCPECLDENGRNKKKMKEASVGEGI